MELLVALTNPLLEIAGMPMSLGDILGFATGIACVWLTARANVWNFPAGILNSLILGVVFLQQRLFADAGLQVFFVVLALQGWLRWLRRRHAREDSPVFPTTLGEQGGLMLTAAVATFALWQTLIWMRGAAPFVDALITALSLCAQWQLNRRQLASWAWWITVDLISIPLYWSRGLPLIAALYVVFLLICVKGWLHWRSLTPPVTAGAAA
jgi:nicotinamide mononucleotide transporter